MTGPPHPISRPLPSGTVTFLFTDIEGSTRLWQEQPEAMATAHARHDEILREAIESNHGYVFQIVGDSFSAAFHNAMDGVKAALKAQQNLVSIRAEKSAQPYSTSDLEIKVRMGIHTGAAKLKNDSKEVHYDGYTTLALTQRIMSAGHGGQVLISNATQQLIRDDLPDGLTLHDMGERRLKDLIRPERLYQLVIPNLPADFPPLKTLDIYSHNLPIQLTSFIGRNHEIREITKLITEHRVLTLTGSGGTGKTRLSLQVAADLLNHFDHGVWFAELAPLTNPELIPQTILSVIGVSEQANKTPLEILKKYLHEKKVLIILDNCEHLIEASAKVVDTLLVAAPGLKVLASSREALGVKGELSYLVPSLSLPDPNHLPAIEQLSQYEAVQLFVDRALLVAPHFVVDKDNAPFIAKICHRLDGIPLAIELAAARIKMMSVKQISARLDDRFRLLTGGARTALPRQRTLRALIDWSYDILTDNERLLLQRLSVFAGGCTLEAAEEVCIGVGRNSISPHDILDLLTQLVNKSLVMVMEHSQTGETRYRMLETIRQYAREKLDEKGQEALMYNRHLDYFVAFVEETDETLRGAEQESGLGLLDRELDNLRAALTWSAKSNNVETMLRLASALWRYWRVRSYFSEGRHWLEDGLSRDEPASSSVRAKALMAAGSLANYQADYARARLLLEESLALHRELNDKLRIAICINLISHGKMMTGDLTGAQASLEESFAIFRDLDDTRGMGYSLYFLGSMHLASGNMAAAAPVLEESLTRLKEAGDTWWVGNTLIQLGWGINRQGDPAKALRLFDEALEISAQFGDTRGTARALMYIAEAKFSQGEYETARAKYIEGLRLFNEIGDKWWATVCIEGLAHIAAHQNNARHVARLLGATEHMHERLGAPIPAVYRESLEWSADRARAQLGAQEFSEAWNEGHALTYDQAIQLAMMEPA